MKKLKKLYKGKLKGERVSLLATTLLKEIYPDYYKTYKNKL